ncbi:MAG: CDF family Co(II)/Ni(II) efflux transporter DmeF [Planctomycetes bacterium]|nr:CDF family Co(II)/Ni(II) efflux transporter DmeF [Planctomycetota bacterium]
MHTHSIEKWKHEHVFLGREHARNERRVRFVVALTLAMMVAEIVAGTVYGSLALLADGWHMATHAGALTISAAAYAFARRRARDSRFVFGTGKVGELAGFTSAVILAGIASIIGFESIVRLWQPSAIRFDEAILVACVGLAVNLASAALLNQKPEAHHDHDEGHVHAGDDGDHAQHDHNLRAAYLHVMADALTSVLAIAALLAGKHLDLVWMDAACGLLGAAVILSWSFRLLRGTGAALLDVETDSRLPTQIRGRIEHGNGDKLADLHVWRVGPGGFAAILSIVSDDPRAPDHYKALLHGLGGLAHVTVEVQPCADGRSPRDPRLETLPAGRE